MVDYIVPGLLFFCCALALGKRESAYDLMLEGAGEGLKLTVSLVPALVLLLTAVSMGCCELLINPLESRFADLG